MRARVPLVLLLLLGIGVGVATAVQEPQRTVHVLYEVAWGEQFNFRKSVVARAVSVVRALADADAATKYVLVLAPFHSEDTKGEHLWHSWASLFRVAGLSAVYPHMTDFDQYEKEHGPHVDALLKNSACGPRDVGVVAGKGPVTEYYFGSRIQFAGLGCHGAELPVIAGGEKLTQALLSIVHGNPELGSFMMDYFERVLPQHVHPAKPAAYWEIRQHLPLSDALEARATDYLAGLRQLHAASAPASAAHPPPPPAYIALHLRRKDFVRGHSDSMSSTAHVAAMLLRVGQRLAPDSVTGRRAVFLATDGTDEETAELRSALAPHGVDLWRHAVDGSLSGPELMLTEQILCARAQAFIGTMHSHFSKEIHMERKRLLAGEGGGRWVLTSRSLAEGGRLVRLCGDDEAGGMNKSATRDWENLGPFAGEGGGVEAAAVTVDASGGVEAVEARNRNNGETEECDRIADS
jgi:hypothetical protein